MHLFYTPDITTNEYTLPEEESKHCIKVLRLEVGNEIFLIDGKGGFYRCEIIQAQPKRCEVRCVEKTEEYGKRAFHIHIAIAPTKNIERIEWFLEKCTEIGIDEITPLLCDHSERKVIKEDRLEKVIISAMKQSLKAYLPKLNPLTEFSRFVKNNPSTLQCIAHCDEGYKKSLQEIYQPGQDITILIGPEGDFSGNEITLALENNFIPVTLGESRLRTETAGIVACHSINFMNEIKHKSQMK
ncbi:MAG TPA: 16S rRNA (uracil(1498)-N(3))-methyltransferase [Butyricimonas virosa]|jgi:RNA methyltransferase, rsmE family|uniref:Ribosomal RNA small subunit methyltransferase E n=1 Tax=Butyricimonas virosa TaxID=544645 RepID=A0A413IJN0_9BACT|nr:16S rRNA (uracil(1498)-N(3))-methyltransferase [Butyricimonas virosa]MCI7295080.1 16S rRNA (uracil(1498)-N(3))-methyltransferase [Butyricimonas virosa]MDY5487770.1 16S rRNA (uracil(1498)-N(3))-methyltransferase [Butyricimonas virosa]MDY6219213.1 16S rRNA (uracil(1498)-N(3))-methyltransferase [Butyricimonas virosa]RGL90091.1 16S rRNA (uracil(1498)-N(3))-methyltransferase [Butyricimonas virosa]RGY13811.1 16S rRNA (uracil(1498)-N(3))-methyltransferase [Butyricimonas virosa]